VEQVDDAGLVRSRVQIHPAQCGAIDLLVPGEGRPVQVRVDNVEDRHQAIVSEEAVLATKYMLEP
jgi:hypothetical protein